MTLGRLAEGLHNRGITLEVVTPKRKDRDPEEFSYILNSGPGLPIPRYPELRFGLPAKRRIEAIWRESPPDIVHIATEGPLGWSALRAAKRLNLPVVSSFHTNFHSYGNHYGYGFLRAFILRWLRFCHNQTLLTFAPSTDLIKTLTTDGFKNVRLLARGVDTNLFSPQRRSASLRAEWGADQDMPVALYVGRLAPEKNLGLMLKAFKRMQAVLPDIRLVIVGDGPARKQIEESVPEAYFAGMKRGEALATHYASADCFLFASVTETFGNVVTEAMASGLPVLAFDYAAPARFIQPGENGFLAPYKDDTAFLEQATRMAQARATWYSIGENSRATILPHSWGKIVDHYLSEIHSLPPLKKARSA